MNSPVKQLAFVVSFSTATLLAQQDRIVAPLDPTSRVVLRGNVHVKAQPLYDRGRVDPTLEISYVTLLLKPSPDQQVSLDRLLADQQEPSSPSHHKWLTPEQFADRFGASSGDIAKIVAWLESQGLTINDVARGRHWISFTGKAAEIDRAFRTEIHGYGVDGETHFANATEPSIPSALANVVGGVDGLDDFSLKPQHIRKKLAPEYTRGSQHLLAPDDLATIYNIAPLYSAGIDGTGQKLVIVGSTDIDLADIQAFRARFNLPPNDPQLVLVGPDPGTSAGPLGEADLDIEWSGAVARNATIVYVYGRSINNAIQYAIDQNLAPVISISFGNCEQNLNPTLRSVAQQGNAQGITLIAASGDSGAAACDAPFSRPQATQGMAVSFPASLPEVTAVGGAQFNEGGDNYWSVANTASSASALSYIPEIAWNETDATGLASSGGGASILYPKPAWQSGPGVPSDNARDVPDLVLSAAGHDGYVIVSEASNFIVAGTSAAAPSFAGIVALLNQYLVSTGAQAQPGLGNINPALYRLAQTSPNAFHDITDGDNMVPCWQASPGCSAGAFGYQAATGYDLATGLGSVDAYNLITQWNSQSTGTTVVLTANPSNVSLNSTMQLTATVSASSGGPISGSVSFNLGDTGLGVASLTATASATLTVYGSELPIGVGTITAIYSGDGQHSGSSASIAINVSAPAANSAVIPAITPNPVFAFENLSGANRLTSWTYSVRLKEAAGVPTTLIDYTINGVSYAPQIVSYFGKAAIAANGTLSAANLTLTNLTPPETVVFGFSGVDADGQKWSQQLSVPFYGAPPTEDFYVFSERPTTMVQDPNADPSCQWSQQLNVQELYGVPHRLTRLVAGGVDISNQIQQIFGTTQVAPFGGLYGKLCWTGITPPQTSNLQLDGVTLSASFRGPAASPIPITVSPPQITLSAADSSQTATASVAIDFGGNLTQAWTINKFPLNVTNNWLTIFPTSGTGPAQLNLKASAAGLANGVYTATVIVTAPNSAPGYANLTVVFVVGASSTTTITGAANAASHAGAFAPGMLMTVSGSQLAPATVQARTFPLGVSMAGVSATVNGITAPVSAVAPDQLTIQIPYETGAGPAVLCVNNNGQVAAYSFQVAPSAPGIFADQNGGLVPVASGRPGQTLVLSITGEGDTSPALANGSTPALGTSQSRLPSPRLPVTMSIGGEPAQIVSASIPSGFVGKTLITFKIPSDANSGVQPVVVTVGGVDSPPATVTVTP